MKIILSLLTLFLSLTSNAQDSLPKKKIYPKEFNVCLLYQSNLPYGLIGGKLAIAKIAGAYVSLNYSNEQRSLSYLMGGLLVRASKFAHVYVGSGVGPQFIPYEGPMFVYYGPAPDKRPEFKGLSSFALEAGYLLHLGPVTVDLGAGMNFKENLYGKVGLGVNL
jgi:hypothetical protein